MSLHRTCRRIVEPLQRNSRSDLRTFSTSSIASQQPTVAATFAEALQNSPRQQRAPPRQYARPLRSRTATPTSPTFPTDPGSRSGSYDLAQSVVKQSTAVRQRQQQEEALADMERDYSRKDLDAQMTRRWSAGDVYAPYDLSGSEMKKWKTMQKQTLRTRYDVVDQLALNPERHWKNISMMTEYVTPLGRLRTGAESGLRHLNQRKMQRAVRRAIGGGLILPTTYHHPELLKLQQSNQKSRRFR